MTETCDVLIIGGGILGIGLAYSLARRGAENVVLLEKGNPGDGSTGKSAAIIRMHYTNPATVQLALRSRDLFLNWSSEVGGETVYSKTGWVFLVPHDQESNLRENLAMNQSLGVDADLIGPERIAEHAPGINMEGIAYGVYEANSGCADPNATCRGLARYAAEHGVSVLTGRPVDRILTAGDRVIGAEAGGMRYEAGATVLAAGPWSGGLSREIGLDLPLELTREQELILRIPAGEKAPALAISNMCDRIYLRPVDETCLLLGRGYPKEYETVDVDSFKQTYDVAFAEDVLQRMGHRFPGLERAEIERGVVGLYTVTPDWHPIVGPVQGRPGLWVATGGSGHSFKIGPALGEMLADLMVKGHCGWIDATIFAPERFQTGRTFNSRYGGNRA